LAGNRRDENKTLVKFQLIVTLDKVIYINRNILIVVTQPQFTKQNRFTFSQKKFSLKLATYVGHLVLDVYGLSEERPPVWQDWAKFRQTNINRDKRFAKPRYLLIEKLAVKKFSDKVGNF
jgi:hypothetical protein